MIEDGKIIFRTRVEKVMVIMLCVGFGLLFVSVGLPLILMPDKSASAFLSMLIPIILGLFFSFVLISSAVKTTLTFVMDREGLTIRNLFRRLRRFSWNEIENIQVMDPDESQDLIEGEVRNQFQLREDQDIGGYIRLLKSKSPQYKFFTMTSSGQVLTTGDTGHLRSLDIKKSGSVLLLKTKSGEIFYITPGDTEQFYAQCKKMMI